MAYTILETVTIKKPEDATHFCPETVDDWACWFKKMECGTWAYMYADSKPRFGGTGEWRYNSQVDESTLINMIKL